MHSLCNFNPTKCDKCCFEFIKNSKLLPSDLINNWLFLYEEYNSMLKKLQIDNSLNTKLYIVSSYILIPPIFLNSIRVLLLEYFEDIGISKEILIRGKWLPTNININKRLIESLFITQKIQFTSLPYHVDALDFFTSDSNILHRNKVAHDANEALNHASRITLNDTYFKFCSLAHCVVCLESFIKDSRVNKEICN